MSTSYERTGRTQQKSRTRRALVAAAQELLRRGADPTVEDAAVAAGVSRATAYRYFSTQRALLVAARPVLDVDSLVGTDAPAEPEARLDALVHALTAQILENEAGLRASLRASLEVTPPDPARLPLRQGRAIGWIETALAPVLPDVEPAELRRLALAIRAAVGIEALVWQTDVAGLDRTEAAELMLWSARALLRATS